MVKGKNEKVEELDEELIEEEASFGDFLDEFMGDADEEEQEILEGAPDAEDEVDNRIGAFLSVPQSKTPTPLKISNGSVLSLGFRNDDTDDYTYVYSESVAMVPLESVTEKVKWGGRTITIGGRRCFSVDPENEEKRVTSCGSSNGRYPWSDRLGEWAHNIQIGKAWTETHEDQIKKGEAPADMDICKYCPLKEWTRVDGKGVKPLCQESFTWVVYVPEQEWMKVIKDDKGKEQITTIMMPGRIASFMGKSSSIQMALKGVKKGNSGALADGGAVSGLSSFTVKRGSVEFMFPGDKIEKYKRSIRAYYHPDGDRIGVEEKNDVPEEVYGNVDYTFAIASSTTDVYPDGKPTISGSYNKTHCFPVIVEPRLNNYEGNRASYMPYPEMSEVSLSSEQYMDMMRKWKFYIDEQQMQMRGIRQLQDLQSNMMLLAAPKEEEVSPLYEETEADDVFDATLLD